MNNIAQYNNSFSIIILSPTYQNKAFLGNKFNTEFKRQSHLYFTLNKKFLLLINVNVIYIHHINEPNKVLVTITIIDIDKQSLLNLYFHKIKGWIFLTFKFEKQ